MDSTDDIVLLKKLVGNLLVAKLAYTETRIYLESNSLPMAN